MEQQASNRPDIAVGYEFPPVQVDVTKEMIREFAEASYDFNPLHLDEDWMKDAQFGSTSYKSVIGHGLMTYSFVTRMLTDVVLPSGGWHERCEMRFKSPVFPGDRISTFGRVKNIREESGYLLYEADVRAAKDDGTVCAVGTAVGRMPTPPGDASLQAAR